MVSSAIALEATGNVNTESPQRRPVQVLAVTGGKGGVGKSNVTINLAIELGKLGRKVLVLDADLGLANIDVLCGIKPQGTLADVLRGELSLDEIVVQIDDHVSLLPASSGASRVASMTQVEYGGLIQAFSSMQAPIDILIVDTPAGISNQVTAFCRAAREVVVVVCDEPTSVSDACSTIEVLSKEFQVKRFNILVNKVSSSDRALDLFDSVVERADQQVEDERSEVVLSYLGAIPQDKNLHIGACEQSPVVKSFPASGASIAFKKLAKKIHGWPEPHQPIGHVEFFVERLVMQGVTE